MCVTANCETGQLSLMDAEQRTNRLRPIGAPRQRSELKALASRRNGAYAEGRKAGDTGDCVSRLIMPAVQSSASPSPVQGRSRIKFGMTVVASSG